MKLKISVIFIALMFLLVHTTSYATITKRKGVYIPYKVVIIKKGDTLASLARKYFGSIDKVSEFDKLNIFTDKTQIFPGEKLYVPLAAGEAAKPKERTTPKRTTSVPVKIVWAATEDDTPEFDTNPVKTQHTFVVRALDAYDNPVPEVRIEWSTNSWQNAVGNIVHTDDSIFNPIGKSAALGQSAKLMGKVNNSLAYTYTNSESVLLKRRDIDGKHLSIKRGETWVTVTSTRPGDTDVIAFCPAVPTDKENILFAVARWMDLAWEYPPDSRNAVNFADDAENTHILETKMKKTTDGSPVEGIQVVYTILSLNPQVTFSDGSTLFTSISDERGIAAATIGETEPKVGFTTVLVEIKDEWGKLLDSKRVKKEWVGPNLSIDKSGPDMAALSGDIEYTIQVANTGDSLATSVKVNDIIPEGGMTFVSASHNGRFSDGVVTWDLGNLRPGVPVKRTIVLRTTEEGRWRNVVEVVTADGLKVGGDAVTTVLGPKLKIAKLGPETAMFGTEVGYTIEVQNIGAINATGVVIADTIPLEGMGFVRASEGGLPSGVVGIVKWNVGDLAINQRKTVGITLKTIQEGEWTNTVQVTSNEGITALSSVKTTVIKPSLTLEKKATPTSISIGKTTTFDITVSNTGGTQFTKLVILDRLPSGLKYKEATENGILDRTGNIRWQFDTLQPGASKIVKLTVTGTEAGDQTNKATVSTAENTPAQADATVIVVAKPSVRMTMVDSEDPISVGGEVTYTIVVENKGLGAATKVHVMDNVPQEMNIMQATPSAGTHSIRGNAISFDIGTLQPSAKVTLTIKVKTLEAGDVVNSAELTLNEFERPTIVEEPTTIIE